MSFTLEELLSRLENVKEESNGQYRADCPAHESKSGTALHVGVGDNGKPILNCFGGCKYDDIIAAAGLNGSSATQAEPGTRRNSKKEHKVYTTRDVYRRKVFEFRSPSGEVLYVQQHKGPYFRPVSDDQWVSKLEDVTRVPYKLPELLEGVRSEKTIFHVEGCKDVDTATEWLEVTATTTGGVKTWRPTFRSYYVGANVVILPDNDEEGRAYSREVASSLAGVAKTIKIVSLPGLPPKGDLTDFKEAGGTAKEFYAAIREAPLFSSAGDEWPNPRPLETALPAVAQLDMSLVPEPLRPWTFDIASRMDNAAPDFVAASEMVIAGSLVGRKMAMRPKRQDDWTVIPNLWGGLVGPPSSMKTPALEQALKPVKRLAIEARDEYEEASKEHALDAMIADAEKAALKKRLEVTAKQVAEGKTGRAELQDIRQQLEEFEEPEEPTERRYLTNDATIEKSAEILKENPNGILNYRDELMGFLRNLDKTGRESDRAFYLEAWNGNGSFSVDRIGRGTIHVPALCLSILGGIQPGPLSAYVNDALEEAEKADGLLQRFQVTVWPDIRGYQPSDQWPDAQAKDRAYRVFKGLTELDAKEFGAVQEEDEVPYVRFSPQAQEVFDAWRTEFEPRFRTGEYPAAVESHFLKYRSLFASLALIFEAIEFVDGKSEGGSVSSSSALRAAAWCEYLESHAMRLYHPILTAPTAAAETLLEHIEAGDVAHEAKLRSIYNNGWQGLGTREEVAGAVAILEEYGWVRKVEVKPPGRGRPSEVLHLHPDMRG